MIKLRVCVYNTKTKKLGWIYKADWISFGETNMICWENTNNIWTLPKHLIVINCDTSKDTCWKWKRYQTNDYMHLAHDLK